MSYLFAAFSIVWIVIFLYALSISRRQRELSHEVETLRQMVARQAAPVDVTAPTTPTSETPIATAGGNPS